MRIFILCALLGLCGCRKSAPGVSAEPALTPCQSNADCQSGWVCLAHECADPREKAVYMAPKTAVTPDKVRRHLEQVQADQDRAVEHIVQQAEGAPSHP
jgi:hypothetical protein